MKDSLEQALHALAHYSDATINEIEKKATIKAVNQIKELQTKVNQLTGNEVDSAKASVVNEIINLLTREEEVSVYVASKNEWENLFRILEENYNIHMINPTEYLQLKNETEDYIEYSALKTSWDAIWDEVGDRENIVLK
ncbi:hypothetical protein [Bacillus cereus]|uniref:hypothetical protein n=1 Tax=Bacillus cereus TaxID=1396 RepID=UPI000B4B6E88|nr:hypothetical protein [Bacillus cereus]